MSRDSGVVMEAETERETEAVYWASVPFDQALRVSVTLIVRDELLWDLERGHAHSADVQLDVELDESARNVWHRRVVDDVSWRVESRWSGELRVCFEAERL